MKKANGMGGLGLFGWAVKTLFGLALFGIAGMMSVSAMAADDYPSREITWVIYQAPGGSMDVTSRLIQPYLKTQGINTYLDYVEGGGGRIARTKLYSAKPDGYMILSDTIPSNALGEVIYDSAYKTLEFEPIFGWNEEGYQICVDKNSPIKTIKDLVELSKQRPIKAATIGRGGSSHLQLVLLQKILGIPMNIVHFSGSSKAYPQLWGGHIDIACSGPGSGARNMDKLNFLCVFRKGGEPALPGAPTVASLGYDVPEVNQLWYATTSPKVPLDRVKKLENAFATAFKNPELIEAEKKAGFESVTSIPREELIKKLKVAYDLSVKYKDELK